MLTILTAVAAVLVSRGGDGDSGAATQSVASKRTAEVDAARVEAGTSTSGAVAGPPVVPATPVVTVGPAVPDGCIASWTVDDGGSPVLEYVVTRESAAAPPDRDGTELGTRRADRTADTAATVDPGGTIRVAATNSVGDGPVSDPAPCG